MSEAGDLLFAGFETLESWTALDDFYDPDDSDGSGDSGGLRLTQPLWDPERGATERGLDVFTAGDCWSLAWWVARASGGAITLVGDPEDWCHVLVALGPDHYLDATGCMDEATLAARWSETAARQCFAPGWTWSLTDLSYIADWGFARYERFLDSGFVYPEHRRDAEEFAEVLLARHALMCPRLGCTNPGLPDTHLS